MHKLTKIINYKGFGLVFNIIKNYWFVFQILINSSGMSNTRKEQQQRKDEDIITPITFTSTKTTASFSS
jgi:hypothetical protein